MSNTKHTLSDGLVSSIILLVSRPPYIGPLIPDTMIPVDTGMILKMIPQ